MVSLKAIEEKVRDFLKTSPLKEKLAVANDLLKEKGFYLVGGAIRDIVLKKNPLDFDFAVEGKGVETAREFARRIRGKFVLLSEKDDEARVVKREEKLLLTFDFKGMVGGKLSTDLLDRDFTINACAFGPLNQLATAELFDPFSGLLDLRRKIIRPVGPESLKRDPLRILRGIRFALELNFRISKTFWLFAREITFGGVARERIGYEILRILSAPRSYPYIRRLFALGILSQIFPSFAFFFQEKEVFHHSFLTYKKMELILSEGRDRLNRFFQKFPEWERYLLIPQTVPVLKFAALFHDLAKPLTRREEGGSVHFYGHDALGAKLVFETLKRELRLSNFIAERVKRLVLYHMRLHLLCTRTEEITERACRRFLRDLGEDAIGLMALTCADGYATARRTKHLMAGIEKIIQFQREEEKKKRYKRLVTGYDLIDLGLKPGPIFKKILQEIEELTLEEKIKTKEEGIEYIKENYLKTADALSPETRRERSE
jgi:poly(A) polymerase